MTRKDYILIAAAIKEAHDGTFDRPVNAGPVERGAVYDTAAIIARVLHRSNERFDRARFMAACGFPGGQ